MRPLAAAVAMMAGALVSCSGCGTPVGDITAPTPVDSVVLDCPAAGHRETFAGGLTPGPDPQPAVRPFLRTVLHALAHVVGLGHTRDRDQLMYPDTAQQTSHFTEYRSGDREELRLLGTSAGCLPAPSPGPPR